MNIRWADLMFTGFHEVSLRSSAVLILCALGSGAAFAQSTLVNPFNPSGELTDLNGHTVAPSINFEGEWRYDYGNRFDPDHAFVRFEQHDSSIKIYELGHGYPAGGRLAFVGTYSGNLIDGTGYPSNNNPPNHSTVRIQDPDTLIMPNRTVYHRNILSLKDVPCDEQNSFRVNDDGAKKRLEMAIREKDYPQMFCWAVIAGNKDDNDARYLAGMMLYKGIGVAQNYERAFLFLRASAIFDQDAALLVADMFDRGQGTPADPKQAAFWRGRAATLRHIEAFQELSRQSAAYQESMNSIFGWVGENCGMSISQSNAWQNNVSTRGKDPCANGRRW